MERKNSKEMDDKKKTGGHRGSAGADHSVFAEIQKLRKVSIEEELAKNKNINTGGPEGEEYGADNPDDYWKSDDESRCAWLARNQTFEIITLAIISFNAMWMGFDADTNDAEAFHEADIHFIIVENFLCTFYTFELIIRFVAFRYK